MFNAHMWGGGGMITFLAPAHMLNATQLVWGGGGRQNVGKDLWTNMQEVFAEWNKGA